LLIENNVNRKKIHVPHLGGLIQLHGKTRLH